MARKKMILVAAEDVHTMVVGSLKAFQHKRQMANNPEYREAAQEEARQPTTMREMFGLPAPTSMRTALGLG